jgi:hypothetical protein
MAAHDSFSVSFYANKRDNNITFIETKRKYIYHNFIEIKSDKVMPSSKFQTKSTQFEL